MSVEGAYCFSWLFVNTTIHFVQGAFITFFNPSMIIIFECSKSIERLFWSIPETLFLNTY